MQGGGQFTPRSSPDHCPMTVEWRVYRKRGPWRGSRQNYWNSGMWRVHCVSLSGLRGEPGLLTWSWDIFTKLQWQVCNDRGSLVCLSLLPKDDGAWRTFWGWRDCPSRASPPHWERNRSLNGRTRHDGTFSCFSHHPCERGSLYALHVVTRGFLPQPSPQPDSRR